MSDDSNDKVGYKKPPKDTQFKPGQSGNPRGRPRGSVNLRSVFYEQLGTLIPIMESGKSRKIPVAVGVMKGVMHKALRQDLKAVQLIVSMDARWGNSSDASGESSLVQALRSIAMDEESDEEKESE